MKTPLISLLLSTAAFAAPVWKQDGNRSLELSDDKHVIVRFLLEAAPRDPHFEILATADGRNTVWVGPADHVWHYGMWFSWKYINGVNFWETDPKTGRQQGRNEILDPVIESQPHADTATIRYRELSYPEPDGPAVLEDHVIINIGRGPQVTWSITTKALADVKLDRTPLPAEPDGKDWGGYGGFSWRGAKDFKDLTFTDSEGRANMDIHRHHAGWLNITGNLHGKPAGLCIIDQPSNPGHPQSWYLFHNPKLPFWFANPALLQPKPVTLDKDASFQHSYRVIIHDGTWEKPQCGQAAELFRKP